MVRPAQGLEYRPVLFFTRNGPGYLHLPKDQPLREVRVIPEVVGEVEWKGEPALRFRDRVFFRVTMAIPCDAEGGWRSWLGWEHHAFRNYDRPRAKDADPDFLLISVYVEQAGVAI